MLCYRYNSSSRDCRTSSRRSVKMPDKYSGNFMDAFGRGDRFRSGPVAALTERFEIQWRDLVSTPIQTGPSVAAVGLACSENFRRTQRRPKDFCAD
jgi:hypothetical protein